MKDDEVREFMTSWFGPGSEPMPMAAWSVRPKAGLMGTAKSKRFVPGFRPFDMLAEPNESRLIFENASQRIGVESVCGAQPEFRRHLDFNTLYFQFSGRTAIETECGPYEMGPGELMLVPEGIAHRAAGTADSLRWWFQLHEPVHVMYSESQEVSRTEFEVVRENGPEWTVPADRRAPPKGRVTEKMVQWRDPSEDYYTFVERDYERLVGVTSRQRDKAESVVAKVRAFDCFTEMTGQRGPGPKLVATDTFALEAYNTVGPQFAFHRGLESEEFGIQFAGRALNLTELEAEQETLPGACALVPLGIAHSVLCDPGFLRVVPYSRAPWDVKIDATKHAHASRFKTIATVVKPPAWHQQKPAGGPPHGKG